MSSRPGSGPAGSFSRDPLVALLATVARLSPAGARGSRSDTTRTCAHVAESLSCVDWSAIRALADGERLTGYLYHRLVRLGHAGSVSPEFLLEAKRQFLRQWRRGGELLREIERLATAFDREGLVALFFKGPLLARELYGQLGARASGDIDFLIPAARNLAAYDRVLKSLGFKSRSVRPLPWSLTRRAVNQLEYADCDFVVEPHWSLTNPPPDRVAGTWRDRCTVPAIGREVQTLSREHTLLANVLAIPADLQNDALGLRTLFELHLLRRRFPPDYDWNAFWSRRKTEGTQTAACAALAAAERLFGEVGDSAFAAAPSLLTRWSGKAQLLAELYRGRPESETTRRRLAFDLTSGAPFAKALHWVVALPVRMLSHPRVTWSRLQRSWPFAERRSESRSKSRSKGQGP